MRIKSFKLFEGSSDDINDILSIVKEMLKELDFIDISSRAVIRRNSGVDIIRISIWKTAIDLERKSFEWEDISVVFDSINYYLESNDFIFYEERELENKDLRSIDIFNEIRTQYMIKYKRVK